MAARRFSSLELLEARIAPASITFTDIDGDKVTVQTSKGSVQQLENAVHRAPVGVGFEIQEIDFSQNSVFSGTDLSVTAVKLTKSGDARVNVGYIDASPTNGGSSIGDGSGINLGKIFIDGDLGQIDAGVGADAVSVAKLTVGSFGRVGSVTQDQSIASQASDIVGRIGALAVRGDLGSIVLSMTAADQITVGGNLYGDIGQFTSTALKANGTIKTLSVRGNIEAREGDLLVQAVELGSLSVGGSVLGGHFPGSAFFNISGKIGSISIGGNLSGERHTNSAFISAGGDIGKVSIRGSITSAGHDGLFSSIANSGSIFSGGDIGPVKIGGDLIGADNYNANTTISFTGAVRAQGSIASVMIRGSIIGGVESDDATLVASGYIGAGTTIGAVTVGGSVIGNTTSFPGIVADAPMAAVGGNFLAIKSVKIGGSFSFSTIAAGFVPAGLMGTNNQDAQMGPVKIGGSFHGGIIAAGTGGGTDLPKAFSKIASVTIGGTVTGLGAISVFAGVTSQEIGALKIGKAIFALTPGRSNDGTFLIGATNDTQVRELP